MSHCGGLIHASGYCTFSLAVTMEFSTKYLASLLSVVWDSAIFYVA